jgi:hypothetical protein
VMAEGKFVFWPRFGFRFCGASRIGFSLDFPSCLGH